MSRQTHPSVLLLLLSMTSNGISVVVNTQDSFNNAMITNTLIELEENIPLTYELNSSAGLLIENVDNVTIHGNGFTVDGNFSFRGFWVEESTNLVISDLVIANCQSVRNNYQFIVCLFIFN